MDPAEAASGLRAESLRAALFSRVGSAETEVLGMTSHPLPNPNFKVQALRGLAPRHSMKYDMIESKRILADLMSNIETGGAVSECKMVICLRVWCHCTPTVPCPMFVPTVCAVCLWSWLAEFPRLREPTPPMETRLGGCDSSDERKEAQR